MPILDASVVVECIAPGVDSSSLRCVRCAVLRLKRLLATRLLLTECANARLPGVKRGKWSGAAADLAYKFLVKLPLRLADDAQHLNRAWELSRRYDSHPIYYMVYVVVAEAARTTLITADSSLRSGLTNFSWIGGLDTQRAAWFWP